MSKMRLWYRESAPCVNDFVAKYTEHPMDGWEKWSLPIGNGYMGVNVFGRTETERLQITENSLCNPGNGGGLNNFCEMLIDYHHTAPENYIRELDIDDGIAGVRYTFDGVNHSRRMFTSYPDRVFVVRHEASKAGSVSFTLRPVIPFLKESPEGYSKRGRVFTEGDTVTMVGEMEYFALQFEGQFRILHEGGTLSAVEGGLHLEGADSATIVVAIGTNYRMESRVFTEKDPKKKFAPYPHPHAMVTQLLNDACEKGFALLEARHLDDYRGLMGRVSFELDPAGSDLPTDELLRRYAEGEKLGYLEMLYYQYGRHLLISSSRPGTLPANLQGVWNCYDDSPWGAGYWHNINVQMNYWPAFVANLGETFDAYAAYAQAYMEQAKIFADAYISELLPENYSGPGKNGWILGTAGRPFEITSAFGHKRDTGKPDIGHSGPGVGAFTSILFWEYYAFTGNREALEKITYPLLHDMAIFLQKAVTEVDGKYLAKYSASPEQMFTGTSHANAVYYHTVGCNFDQQLIYENHYDLVRAADLLGITDEVVEEARRQLPHLDPVQIGASGQIKEYREENAYGEIGEWHHRHISHLCGLYPGSVINRNTPEWMEAARVTLDLRGDKSTGWAMAHRLNAWARVMDGNRAHKLYRTLLSKGTYPNLWDSHPPFQIDGNFGGVSGVSEMLLQSQAGFIDICPALSDEWAEKGSFRSLVARGNFIVDAAWQKEKVTSIRVESRIGGKALIRCDRLPENFSAEKNGASVSYAVENGCFAFDTEAGDVITIRA